MMRLWEGVAVAVAAEFSQLAFGKIDTAHCQDSSCHSRECHVRGSISCLLGTCRYFFTLLKTESTSLQKVSFLMLPRTI
jgi:hypothetical protein